MQVNIGITCKTNPLIYVQEANFCPWSILVSKDKALNRREVRFPSDCKSAIVYQTRFI